LELLLRVVRLLVPGLVEFGLPLDLVHLHVLNPRQQDPPPEQHIQPSHDGEEDPRQPEPLADRVLQAGVLGAGHERIPRGAGGRIVTCRPSRQVENLPHGSQAFMHSSYSFWNSGATSRASCLRVSISFFSSSSIWPSAKIILRSHLASAALITPSASMC